MHIDSGVDSALAETSGSATRDDVAVHFLRDASALAFDETAQALFSFDQAAAYLWCRLADGSDRDDLIDDLTARTDLDRGTAQGIVEGCLSDWQQLTLLGNGVPATPEAEPELPEQPWREEFAPAAQRRGLLVAGAAYELRCETPAIAAAVEPLLATFPTYDLGTIEDADTEGRVDVTRVLETGGGDALTAEIYIDGWRVADGSPLEALAPMLKFCLTSDRVDGTTHEIALHAGAITLTEGEGVGARGVLLAGPAGTGKSTLGAGLAGAGCGHVADDTVLFETDTGLFRGFGFAVGLKEGAWPVMARQAPELAHAPTFMRSDDLAVRFLQRQRPVDHPIDVGLVVFPSYRAGAALEVTPLDTVTALRQLLAESGSGAERLTGAMFHRLVAWLDGARAVRLTYGGLDDAVDAVRELAAEP